MLDRTQRFFLLFLQIPCAQLAIEATSAPLTALDLGRRGDKAVGQHRGEHAQVERLAGEDGGGEGRLAGVGLHVRVGQGVVGEGQTAGKGGRGGVRKGYRTEWCAGLGRPWELGGWRHMLLLAQLGGKW